MYRTLVVASKVLDFLCNRLFALSELASRADRRLAVVADTAEETAVAYRVDANNRRLDAAEEYLELTRRNLAVMRKVHAAEVDAINKEHGFV